MTNKKKLRLENLKIQSFVTSLNNEDKRNIKGGTFPSAAPTFCGGAEICDDSFIWRCTGYYCPEPEPVPEDPVDADTLG